MSRTSRATRRGLKPRQPQKASAASSPREQVILLAGQGQYPQYANLGVFREQAEAYVNSPWVYLCVSKIARDLSRAELNVLRRVDERREQIVNHPLELLLERPNPHQSRLELLEAFAGSLLLTGNAYLFLAGEGGGLPAELLVLRPDRLRVVAGADTGAIIGGYLYEVNGTQVPLAAEEIIHWKLWNPLNDFYGLSPLEAGALDVTSDMEMARWNRNYFGRDNAVPAGIVNIKAAVDNNTYQRIVEDWKALHGGPERRTAFLRGADLSYQEIGTSQKEMDFLAGRQFHKETVLQLFGIPPGMLDKNATEANAQAGSAFYTENTLYPLMVSLAAKLTHGLCPFFGDDLVIEPTDIRNRDRAAERADITTASAILTINEIRQQFYGLPPVAWGDRPATGSAAVGTAG